MAQLSSQSGGEGEIGKNIINADLVECIVAMPTQLFYTTQIPVSLWFINTTEKTDGEEHCLLMLVRWELWSDRKAS